MKSRTVSSRQLSFLLPFTLDIRINFTRFLQHLFIFSTQSIVSCKSTCNISELSGSSSKSGKV